VKYNCGIYKIKNIVNGNYYIGQSCKLDNRRTRHFSELKNNIHTNNHLQKAFNKYGEKNFIFKVLIYCEPKELIKYEQFFIDKEKNGLLYNMCRECVKTRYGINISEETRRKMSISKSGEKHPLYGKKHNEETIKKMKLASLGNKNHQYGIPRSEETKKKISMGLSGEKSYLYHKPKMKSTLQKIILQKELVLQIKIMLENNYTGKYISKFLKVSRPTIKKVKDGYYNEFYGI
jgi:group I intron endonuclease